MRRFALLFPLIGTLALGSCSLVPSGPGDVLKSFPDEIGISSSKAYTIRYQKSEGSMDSYLCYQKLELSEESSLRYKEQLSVRKYSLPKDYAFDIKAETASVFTKFKADSPRYEEGYDWCAYLTINDENSRFVDYYLILEADKVTLHVIYSKIQWERGLSPYIDRS